MPIVVTRRSGRRERRGPDELANVGRRAAVANVVWHVDDRLVEDHARPLGSVRVAAREEAASSPRRPPGVVRRARCSSVTVVAHGDPSSAPKQPARALRTMPSKTGWTSVGELRSLAGSRSWPSAVVRLCQLAVACLELSAALPPPLERLRQALLQVADPSAVVLGRLAGDRGLGFDLGLRGLWTPTHRPPLASYESAGDRLGERGRVGNHID